MSQPYTECATAHSDYYCEDITRFTGFWRLTEMKLQCLSGARMCEINMML